MDDPMVIATRYATITRKMVNDAAQVAIDAFDKINASPPVTYTAADAIESMTTARRYRHHRWVGTGADPVADPAGQRRDAGRRRGRHGHPALP